MKGKHNGHFPFFIVTNQGQDVQELSEWIQGLMEKWGIDPILEVLKGLYDTLLALVAGANSYIFLEVLHDFLTRLTDILKKMVDTLDPVLAFDLFKKK